MSDALKNAVDPRGELETNPLVKYQRQLDPLAKLTDQLWQTPRAPGRAPIQAPMPAPSLANAGEQHGGMPQFPAPVQAQMGAEMMTGPGAQPEPLPSSSAAAQQPGWRSTPWRNQPSSALAEAGAVAGGGAAELAAQGAPPGAGGDPTDVTQFRQNPVTKRISAASPASRRLAALAPDVPEYQAGGDTQAPQTSAQAPRSRSEERISTRIPSEPEQKKQGVDAHSNADLTIGLPSMKAGKEAWDKNAKLIKENYPGFKKLRTDNPDRINETFIQHLVDNLKFLHGKMVEEHGQDITDRAGKWYQGANKIAHDLAAEYGMHPRQTAAVLAALSPQKDWYQNVDLARRLLDINQKHGGNLIFTPEMRDYSGKYIDQLIKDNKNPETIAELQALRSKFETTKPGALKTPFEKAVWSRWFDEAHNGRGYNIVTPEGETGERMMVPAKLGKKGQVLQPAAERKVSWGSFKEIAKAMAVMNTTDLSEISRQMGGNHKVRNFYNNIIAHMHGHDVTIDTHAIAAALLRPLGAGALEVGHGLGTTVGKGRPGAANNATLGNKGMYGLYAEAYRRAAKDLRLSPRELQSITWEGVRGLFSPENKRSEKFVQHNEGIWRGDGQYGKMTAAEKRQAVYDHAGGIKLPSWAGGEERGDEDDA